MLYKKNVGRMGPHSASHPSSQPNRSRTTMAKFACGCAILWRQYQSIKNHTKQRSCTASDDWPAALVAYPCLRIMGEGNIGACLRHWHISTVHHRFIRHEREMSGYATSSALFQHRMLCQFFPRFSTHSLMQHLTFGSVRIQKWNEWYENLFTDKFDYFQFGAA